MRVIDSLILMILILLLFNGCKPDTQFTDFGIMQTVSVRMFHEITRERVIP